MPAPRKAVVELCRKLLPETTDRRRMVHRNRVGFDNIARDHGQGPQPGDPIIIRGGYWKDRTMGVHNLDSAHIMVLLEVVSTTPSSVTCCAARGLWTLTGKTATVDRDDGTPTTGNTGTITRVMKAGYPPRGVPDRVTPNWMVG